MELSTGLILLGILIVPPLFLVGRRVLNRLFFDDHALLRNRDKLKDARDCYNDEQWENTPVYDGMITVEIPVAEDQVIAYEPLPDVTDEDVVEEPVSRASRH